MGIFLRGIVLIAALWSMKASASDLSSELYSLLCESGNDRNDRQFYVSGIIGASFATLSSGGVNTAGIPSPIAGAISSDLLTAGGAGGLAFERSNGLLRFEVEGRYRDPLKGQTPGAFEPLAYDVQMSDAWSAMANVWRDLYLTNRLGIYGGGGIGAGGYRLSVEDPLVSGSSKTAGFAWQAGAGVTYEMWSRTTLDLGYRFYDLGTTSTPLFYGGDPAGNYASSFSASELLLSVRVYEPFRRFRR